MAGNSSIHNLHPIDAVIPWVDGDDSHLVEKRKRFLPGGSQNINPGAHPTRFASINEIRYCVLSILKFAPFVRNIFVVTDNQDPNLYDDIKKWFPHRMDSVKIVDHAEIFQGYEQYLPTFNSISIGNMVWRIKGLSENFVYFNDDLFLIRPIEPDHWFVGSRPVMRGRWVPAPLPKLLWYKGLTTLNRRLLGKPGYQPRSSFHLGQWNAASLLGFKYRYFAASHTPHAVNRKLYEDFFQKNKPLFEKNISYRFRNPAQFTFVALSNHLQLLDGNDNTAPPGLAYLQPFNRPRDYVHNKLRLCEENLEIKHLCVQSLEMCPIEIQDDLFAWLDQILGIH
jgi:hypothetical protein